MIHIFEFRKNLYSEHFIADGHLIADVTTNSIYAKIIQQVTKSRKVKYESPDYRSCRNAWVSFA
jgi:hypothetical protein